MSQAEADPRLMFLTGDLGFGVFDPFRETYGPRYINVGVAEAQLMCAAAGLALEGYRPIAYSIASFATGRAFEQIRISIAYPGLPVVVVGAGGGYIYANSGVTHHAAEDLALMSLLPGMTVVNPGDPTEVRTLLPELLKLDGPSYIRIGRYGEPTYEAEDAPQLGKFRLIRSGKERLALLISGDCAIDALGAADKLAADGIAPWMYQVHTVKPLDFERLDVLADQVDTLLVVEEHLHHGGVGSAVSQWAAAREKAPRIARLGPADALVLGNPERDQLRARLGYGPEAIEAKVREILEWHA
jgi:transketolase